MVIGLKRLSGLFNLLIAYRVWLSGKASGFDPDYTVQICLPLPIIKQINLGYVELILFSLGRFYSVKTLMYLSLISF